MISYQYSFDYLHYCHYPNLYAGVGLDPPPEVRIFLEGCKAGVKSGFRFYEGIGCIPVAETTYFSKVL